MLHALVLHALVLHALVLHALVLQALAYGLPSDVASLSSVEWHSLHVQWPVEHLDNDQRM